jgi:GT2 family glycosyltransferase
MTVTLDAGVSSRHPDTHALLGVTVVVATFKRVQRLAACLDGVRSQTLQATEVLVVVHDDPESARYVTERLSSWPALRLVEAGRERSVAAYNAGLATATGALVAYVDDDAVPAPDWLERMVTTFRQDERIAAVGGRDVIMENGKPHSLGRWRGGALRVGHVHWFGRITANHHLALGPPRDVDVLKGVNMSFRRSTVMDHGFDERLRGPGAVVHAELSICLPLRARGLRVVYDPSIVVTHYPAPRPAGDDRASLSTTATANAAYNEGLQILEYLQPGQRCAFLLWSLCVGTTDAPGFAVLLRDLVRGKPQAFVRFVSAQKGRAMACLTRLRR